MEYERCPTCGYKRPIVMRVAPPPSVLDGMAFVQQIRVWPYTSYPMFNVAFYRHRDSREWLGYRVVLVGKGGKEPVVEGRGVRDPTPGTYGRVSRAGVWAVLQDALRCWPEQAREGRVPDRHLLSVHREAFAAEMISRYAPRPPEWDPDKAARERAKRRRPFTVDG